MGQLPGTPATGIHAIIIKKDKNYVEKDLSQVKYFVYPKMGHYTNKCLNKELKN